MVVTQTEGLTPVRLRSPHPRRLAALAGASASVLLIGLITAAPAQAATNTLAPVSMTSTTGVVGGGQTVTNLVVKDQTGTQDAFTKYVEFGPSGGNPYSGYRTYTLPGSVSPSSVTAVQITTNYRGPSSAEQNWTWALYNWSTSAWVNVGTNATAPSWGSWATLTFNAPASASSFVSSTGSIRVRSVASNTTDFADIDYESVLVTSSSVADTTPPSVPAGLAVTAATSSSVSLSWSASTDNVGVTGYEVFQGTGTTPVATVTTTSATVTGLSAATAYSFTVKAKDAAGNRSAVSAAVSATTAAAADTTAPSVPAGLAVVGSPTSSSVALSWSASTDNVAVTGYEVFQNGGTTAVASVTGTSATIAGLAASTGYSFTVKAKDAAGNRSAASAAVSATTAAASGFVLPPAGGQFDYQISGGYTPASVVTIVDRDRLDPLGPLVGKYNICYVNTLQTQPDEAASYWPNVPGRSNLILTSGSPAAPVHDPDPAWAGEMLFDVRTATARTNLMVLEKTWITDCKAKGYNAIEPDNLDSWSRSTGLMTEAQDQAFMQLFVAEAHAQGIPVAQKNVPEWGAYAKTTIGFDFEISEECQESAGSCQQSQTIYGNDLVFELEYWYETNDSSSGVTINKHTFAHFTAACNARGAAIRITMRNREVIPAVAQPVVLSTAAQAGGYYYNAC